MTRNQTEAETQRDVIAFLLRPESYGRAKAPVTRIDTHISVIFLVGDRAYKMKRTIRFPYLDYGTVDRRRHFCELELAVNRRTAPSLYRRVMSVTREVDGALCLDGVGTPVEWLIEMTRFDQDTLFDRMATADRLTTALMTTLADSIAAFHDDAEAKAGRSGAAAMRWVVDGNNREIGERVPIMFAAQQVEHLRSHSVQALDDVAALLDDRAVRGRLRHCHGDLHLRNICLFEGRPTLFDGVEFNEAITSIDVLYDLAFLLMDLEHRGHRDLANIVFNRYLAMTGDLDGLAAMPLFLSCRAAIRTHTTAAAASAQPDPTVARELEGEARAYLDLACDFLTPPPPQLIAVGGLSGTGKSTLAGRLAPLVARAPGALLLRSDVIRKRMFGVAPEAELDAAAYTSEQSAHVYAHLQRDAQTALSAGQSVITDAVFARSEERSAIEAIATKAGVPMIGLWLEAPGATLQARVTNRTGDASDADATVVQQQLAYDLGQVEWRRIDASEGTEETFAAARKVVAV
ncbi:MAG: AAA family ATPase [Alphaproteobacteria bacterium]|nr:AAA family ATPase [Alphaproteobacteria bacterium]